MQAWQNFSPVRLMIMTWKRGGAAGAKCGVGPVFPLYSRTNDIENTKKCFDTRGLDLTLFKIQGIRNIKS